MYYQIFMYHLIWISQLDKLTILMEKIVHYGCLSIFDKIHERIPTKIIF